MAALDRRRPLAAGPTHAAPKAGSSFTGTGALLRLNLRLDRVRILLWTVAVGLGVYGSVYSLDQAFTTEEAIQARGALLTNPATIMMTGPAFAADDYTFGAMVANELSLYVFLTAAIMAILLAVRHTRAEEESGRLEMIRALPVGRFAPATAAVGTVALACFLVGAATAALSALAWLAVKRVPLAGAPLTSEFIFSRPASISASVAVSGGAIRKIEPMPGNCTTFMCRPRS